MLALYDPDRSQTPTYRAETRPWSTFVGEIREALNGKGWQRWTESEAGRGSAIFDRDRHLADAGRAAQRNSHRLSRKQNGINTSRPIAINARAGAMMAFGQPVNTIYDFSKAGSDSVARRRFSFRASREICVMHATYAARRRMHQSEHSQGRLGSSRLYVIEEFAD